MSAPVDPEVPKGPGGQPSRRRVGLSDEARRALVEAVLRRSDTAFADRVRQIAEEDQAAGPAGPVILYYLDLADYLTFVAIVTGLGVATVVRMADIGLADSALHAPQAGWSDYDLYSGFVEKAAVLAVRLTKNHALPDGNKRAGWIALRLFVELNEWEWADFPGVDAAQQAMLAVASGEWDETALAEWLRPRLRPIWAGDWPPAPAPEESTIG